MSKNKAQQEAPQKESRVMTKYDRKMQAYQEQERKERAQKQRANVIGVVVVLAVAALVLSFPIRNYLAVNGAYIPVGGEKVGTQIARIMGVEAGSKARQVAFVKCAGTCDKAGKDYEYHGLNDCIMVNMMQAGGPKSCNYGCLGEGSCVKACPFDAIHIVDGVALVDKDACKACGKCIAVCPKKLIELVPYDQNHLVQCSSRDKGKDVMKACSVGCIGCKMCEKVCESDAIKVEGNVAHIDPEKCTDCGKCAEKCPKKCIK